jgi:hypothetical protein
MAIQRLLSAVRTSPFWQAGKSLTEAIAAEPGPGGGVDVAWYLRRYRGLTQGVRTVSQCIEHHNKNAAQLQLNPNLLFDEKWYRHCYPEVETAILSGKLRSGWEHYLLEGAARQYNPAFWFDERWYQRRHPEPAWGVKNLQLVCGFEHYLLYGIYDDLQPSLYFHPVIYRSKHMAATSTHSYPVIDYLMSHNQGERCPAPFFDETWYRSQYLNDSFNGEHSESSTGFMHYMLRGRQCGHSPSPHFNELVYREMNPEVACLIREGRFASGFEHYAEEGVLSGICVPTHQELGGVDYAGPEFLRSYERSLRLNFWQFRRLRELLDQDS